jgi:hypothetical protein
MKIKYQIVLLFWSVAVLLPTLVNAFHYLIHHHDFQKHYIEGYWIEEAHDHHICPDALFKVQPHFFDVKFDFDAFKMDLFSRILCLYQPTFVVDLQSVFLRGPPKLSVL